MPSNPSVLALFANQPPVEPTTPKPEYGSDSDFNDYLSNATNQVDQAQKASTGDSAQNNNQDEIRKAEKSKPKIKNKNTLYSLLLKILLIIIMIGIKHGETLHQKKIMMRSLLVEVAMV